jgi:aspartate-semialdehyde dehydrogenase
LEQRAFPVGAIRLFASPASVGRELGFRGVACPVEAAEPGLFEGLDFVFFSAGATRSRELVPSALAAGALVVDNSSAFRMDPGVPLVVPEANGGFLRPDHRLVANPNCCVAILAAALAPLAQAGTVRRLVLATYQSASGGGAALMDDLLGQTRAAVEGRPVEPRVSPHPYAFNVFSHNTAVGPDGSNEEERKVAEELRKVMGMPDLGVSVTCVRVPVLRAHSIAANVEFEGPAPSVEEARAALAQAPGIRLVDDAASNHYPMPSEASGADEVLVGRVRHDPSHPSAVSLFVCGDQLRKGAALNAVQIAERCLALRAVPA